jgi:putative transposase
MSEHALDFPMGQMCQILGVSRSGYYAWRKRKASRRAQANAALVKRILEVHGASRRTYGSPRVHAALKREGMSCGHNRVARLMQHEGIMGKSPRRKHPVTTQREPGNPVAPNVLAQDFTAEQPDRKWVADITFIDTAEGWLYLAPVLDLYSRKVVGWSMDEHMDTSLVEAALHMAVARRCPEPGLLHHSDQGSQYTSTAYQQRLSQLKAQVSMSRVGNCYDNAAMESFIGTLKTECLTGQFKTRALARTAIFEYIEVWYNRQRLHSSLGYLSPEEFEHTHFLDINPVH